MVTRGARALVPLSLCVLLGGGAWIWWNARTEIRPASGASAGEAANAAPDVASEAVSSTDPAQSGVVAERRELVTASGPGEATVPAGPMVQVRVLGSDGAPVPDVAVFYADQGQASVALAALGADERYRLTWDSEQFLTRFGAAATTDSDGVARWPWHERERAHWYCFARRGADYGEAWISMAALAATVHDLRLVEDVTFPVQVVDASQQAAAGVPIHARFADRNDPARSGGPMLGTTDAEGRLVARHAQIWCSDIVPRGTMLPATVEVDLPGVVAGREIDAARPPTEAIVLTLPPLGAIEVTVRDALGDAVADAQYELREDVVEPHHVYGARTDSAGVARYAFVGLGRQWRLGEAHTPADRAKVVDGPRAAGETVHVLLQPDPVPVLTGQLWRDGTAVADAAFTVTSAGQAIVSGQLRTDADGRFRVGVLIAWRDRTLTGLDVYTSSAEHGYDGTSAEWRGELVLGTGTHDLGVLALQSDPVVCAGHLIAPDGEVVSEDVQITLQPVVPQPRVAGQWLSVRLRRDADGHFVFFGRAPDFALQVAVGTWGKYLPVPPTPFATGARDLRIELHRGGSLRASIVARSQLAAFCLQPRLVSVLQPVEVPDYARFVPSLDPRMACDSSFVADDPLEMAYTWPALVPGRYRLEVGTRGVRLPIVVIQDIVVVDGQRNEEARLQHLEVPGLRTIEITLPQAADVAREPGNVGRSVIFVLEGNELGEQCWHIDNENAFFAAAQPLDLLVRLHGYRDRIVRGIVAKETIRLEPGIPVTLRSAFSPPAGGTVSLALESLDDVLTARNAAVYSAAMGGAPPPYRLKPIEAVLAAGDATLRLPAPGRYRVHGTLRSGEAKVDLDAEPAELQVGPAGGTFAIALHAR